MAWFHCNPGHITPFSLTFQIRLKTTRVYTMEDKIQRICKLVEQSLVKIVGDIKLKQTYLWTKTEHKSLFIKFHFGSKGVLRMGRYNMREWSKLLLRCKDNVKTLIQRNIGVTHNIYFTTPFDVIYLVK